MSDTLFDLSQFEREDTKGKTRNAAREVTVKMKVTEYKRRVPDRKNPPTERKRKSQPKKTIAERFAVYHEANPHVYKMLVALARADKNHATNPLKHAGVQMYLEQVRFRMRRQVSTGEPFKISNDFAAHYARLIMQQEPDLDGFFEVRELKSK